MSNKNEIRVANKKDVWHLVQRGILTQLHFDFEGYGLNTRFTQIASYGDAAGDIAGNYIGSEELEVMRPDRAVPTIQSLAVTRTSPHELDKEGRLPHRVAMAKMAQRFENTPLAAKELALEGFERFRTIRKKGEDLYPTEHAEEVLYYPLFDPDKKMEVGENGEIVSDPPGMLKLNDKGEVTYGPEEKVVTIPKATGTKWDEEAGQEVTVYEYKPMKPEDGAINFDVRIHPKRNKIAYRFDEDPKSDYYENIENGYYLDNKDDKWKFSDARLLISGYRIKWYDIPVLRPNLIRGGFHSSNIFFTHSKATISRKQMPKNFAVDGYSMIMNTHLFGPQDERGLKIAERTDQRSGEEVSSAKLELVMQENTRYENKDRKVRGGIFMPDDGSIYDSRRGHKSPAYDSKASFAAYNYCREIAPHLVKQIEMQSDEDYLREMLPGMDLRNPHPPIYAMMRSNYPDKPAIDPMAFVGFDDQQGQLRRAISVRLDLGDLKNFTYKGKSLEQMAKEDHKQKDPSQRNFVRMIKEKLYSPDGLVRLDSMRKFHGAIPLADAMHTQNARNWDLEQIDDNFRFLVDKNNDHVLEAIRDAVEVVNWEMRQDPLAPNPRVEEEAPFNGFGDIDFLEFEAREEMVKRKNMPRKGQTNGVVQMLYEAAMDVYKYHNTVDELVHRLAIQPMPIDMYGYDDSLDLKDAVANYWDVFNKVRGRFEDKNCPYIHLFDEFYDEDGKVMEPGRIKGMVQIGEKKNGDPRMKRKPLDVDDMSREQLEQAAEKILNFRWGIMKRILRDDEMERNDKRSDYNKGLFDHKYSKKGRVLCANLSRDFRIIDERGREMDIEYLKRQYRNQPHLLQKKLEDKKWHIQFYRQTSEPTTSVILMQYADMGKLDELDKLWKFRYEALRALYLHGPQNEDASNMRWDAIPVLEKALMALEVNHPIDDGGSLGRVFSKYVGGEAEVFLRSEEGQRFLGEYKDYLDKIKKEFPMTDLHKMTMQYDPETGLPFDWIGHEIDINDYVLIDVPDPHLRNPLEDTRQQPYSLVVRTVSEEDKARIRKGTPVVLRGMQTGRLYHPGPVSVMKAPDETAAYADYYEEARTAYKEDAGVSFPNVENRNIIRIQGLMPIANVRKIRPDVQTFKVPAQHFDGLVSPRLAHFDNDKPITGLVLPADYCPQDVKTGRMIRFREMEASMTAKIEGKEGKETGFIYETKLKRARRITVGDLLSDVQTGKVKDDKARSYGYAGAYDMWEKINQSFIGRGSPNPMDEEILVLEFDPVNKKSSAFVDFMKAAKAAFIHDGKPLSPSPFRAKSSAHNRVAKNAPLPENDNVSLPDTTVQKPQEPGLK